MAAISSVADLTVDGEVATVTINSPPVNALSAAVRDGLKRGVETANADPAAKAIVVICAGRTFIAGADISEFGKPPAEPYLPDVMMRSRTPKSRFSPPCMGPPSAAGSKSRSRPIIGSPYHPPSSACRRSSSASFPAQAGRSGCRV